MKVSIKDLSVDMEVKNKGVEFDVYDTDDKHLGDLIVTKTGLTWCPGRTKKANGVKVSWADFIKAYSPAAKTAKAAKGTRTAKPAGAAPKKVVKTAGSKTARP